MVKIGLVLNAEMSFTVVSEPAVVSRPMKTQIKAVSTG